MKVLACDVCGRTKVALALVEIRIRDANRPEEEDEDLLLDLEADLCERHLDRLNDAIQRALVPLASWARQQGKERGQLSLFDDEAERNVDKAEPQQAAPEN